MKCYVNQTHKRFVICVIDVSYNVAMAFRLLAPKRLVYFASIVLYKNKWPTAYGIICDNALMTRTARYSKSYDVNHCILLRFRSSSPRGSSSSSRSTVSVGLRMCAMLPRLVGGADMSLIAKFLLSRPAEFHDQLFKLSKPFPILPFEKGAGGVAGRDSE